MTTLPTPQSNRALTLTRSSAGSLATLVLILALVVTPALAVPILNDPNGFEDIPWGTVLSESERFIRIEDAGRTQTYELKGKPPALGTAPVDSIRYMTYEEKFGRVTVRYSGAATHERILAYLQSQYGPLDRTPGQIAVGPIKVYAWHGFDTEVTLRFEAKAERGIIFFESRILREKLSEGNSATVF
jgi:hypothetical protein